MANTSIDYTVPGFTDEELDSDEVRVLAHEVEPEETEEVEQVVEDEKEPEETEVEEETDFAKDKKVEKAEKQEMVPVSRIKKVTHERNELRAEKEEAIAEKEAMRIQLEQLKAEKEQKAVQKELDEKNTKFSKFDLEAKEDALDDAIMSMDKDLVKSIRKEIKEYNAYVDEVKRIDIAKEIDRREAEKESKYQLKLFNDTIATVIKDHPELDSNNDNCDTELLEDVLVYRDNFIKKGFSLSEALLKAVAKVVPQKQATAVTKLTNGPRSQSTLENAKKLAADIPPRTASSGVGSKNTVKMIDISKMSQEEYEALSDTERKHLKFGKK